MFKEKANAQTDRQTHGLTGGRTDGRTHDGKRAMTYARLPMASRAKNYNLKKKSLRNKLRMENVLEYE